MKINVLGILGMEGRLILGLLILGFGVEDIISFMESKKSKLLSIRMLMLLPLNKWMIDYAVKRIYLR